MSSPLFRLLVEEGKRKAAGMAVLRVLVAVQSLSHVQLSVTPWSAARGFPVLSYLLGFAQTQVHSIGDAIQAFHPLSSPSPLALSLSQHQGLFQ